MPDQSPKWFQQVHLGEYIKIQVLSFTQKPLASLSSKYLSFGTYRSSHDFQTSNSWNWLSNIECVLNTETFRLIGWRGSTRYILLCYAFKNECENWIMGGVPNLGRFELDSKWWSRYLWISAVEVKVKVILIRLQRDWIFWGGIYPSGVQMNGFSSI